MDCLTNKRILENLKCKCNKAKILSEKSLCTADEIHNHISSAEAFHTQTIPKKKKKEEKRTTTHCWLTSAWSIAICLSLALSCSFRTVTWCKVSWCWRCTVSSCSRKLASSRSRCPSFSLRFWIYIIIYLKINSSWNFVK